ncbi:MAG: sugar transferase, partial [Ruminococcus sp.]
MYKKSSPNWVKHLDFLLIDLLCLHLAFWSAIIVSKCFGLDFSEKIFIHLSVFITLIDILVHVFSETLKHVLRRGFYKEFAITLKHVCLVELVVVFYAYAILDNNNYSKITLFLMGGFYLVLSYVTRVLWKKIARKGFFKIN